MKIPEVAMILGLCASYDQRTVGEADARAWHKALHERISADDAATAVAEFYAEISDRRIMPADINNRVASIRRARVANVTAPAPPIPLDVEGDVAWRRAYITARADGLNHYQAQETADRPHRIVTREVTPPPTPGLRALAAQAATVPDRSAQRGED